VGLFQKFSALNWAVECRDSRDGLCADGGFIDRAQGLGPGEGDVRAEPMIGSHACVCKRLSDPDLSQDGAGRA